MVFPSKACKAAETSVLEVRKGHTDAPDKLNEEAFLFLQSQLGGLCKNKIVVSHHVPLLDLLSARLRESWGASLYFNRLDDILLDNNIYLCDSGLLLFGIVADHGTFSLVSEGIYSKFQFNLFTNIN